jgi:hypothetical protein
MNRTIIAIATALIAAPALFASGAQACISCEYTPEVVNTPVYSHGGYSAGAKRAYRAAKVHQPRAPKKQVVVRAPAPKKIEAAEVAPESEAAEIPAVAQNSSIALAKADVAQNDDAAEKTTPTAERAPAAKANVDCKKFFPSVGMTLTVPCE